MAATPTAAPSATPALNFQVIDARAAELGVTSEAALAELLGVERTTIWRWRKGRGIALDTADQVAEALQLPLDSIRTKRTA
jgi:transcriptional regulator with XRE-family HTH domain